MARPPASRRAGLYRPILLALALTLSRGQPAAASDLPAEIAAPMAISDYKPQTMERPIPVGVLINGQPVSEPCLVIRTKGRLFVRQDAPGQWGLRLPAAVEQIEVEGEAFSSLQGVPGLSAKLDNSGATLLIDAAPSVFPATHVGDRRRSLPITDAVPAQYVGYDLALSRWNGKWAASAFLDAGLSGGWGVIGTTAFAREGLGGRGLVRLDSNFIRDLPDQRVRLTLGDSVTRGGDWNLPVRFAGIRLGTDFSLAPDDLTYPLPRLSGSSALPSVVDLAAINSRQSLTVQPGDFAIDYQPAFTGAGEVTMTVRDASGAARSVTRSFYTSPRLLRDGLDDFSIEAGFLRKRFGTSSFSYGAPFAAGFWRHGLGGALTVSGRAEASDAVQMAGLGLGAVLSSWGEVALSAAGSQSKAGGGFMWRAQIQRITPRYSVTASYQEKSANFVQVGIDEPAPVKRREFVAAGSMALGRLGNITANFLECDGGRGRRFSTGSLSYAANVGMAWLSLGVRQTRFSESRNTGFLGSLTLPFGGRSSAALFGDGRRIAASLSKTPPPDRGWGYNMLASRKTDGMRFMTGGATLRTEAGDVGLSAARLGDAGGVRVYARGALLKVGAQVIAAPRLDNAFALVDVVADQKVKVFFENRPVGRKAGDGGQAVITGLQPYSANRIAVDLDDLPIDTVLTSAEKTVVPGYRQALKVSFGGPLANPVTLRAVDDGGTPIAEGLAVATGATSLGITGHDGEVFLPDAHEGQEIILTGPAMACRVIVPTLPKKATAARIGPVRCAALQEMK
ncbi:MAG TPA: fimbria/pilus outer membrane usher protein [Sphingobium sp.]